MTNHPILPGVFYVVSSAQDPNLVWDVSEASTADLAQVILFPRTGGPNQQWRFDKVANGYLITARHSGKCLDVLGASQDDRARVVQFTPHGGDNQTWSRFADNIGLNFSLMVVHSQRFLDASGGAHLRTPLIQFSQTGNLNQFWSVTPVAEPV